VVVDDENRENEGDLICAAQATPDMINFMVYARGLICLAMTGDRLDELDLPNGQQQHCESHNTFSNQTAFTISIDAAPHLCNYWHLRACLIQVAINPATKAFDLRRPGHIFPSVLGKEVSQSGLVTQKLVLTYPISRALPGWGNVKFRIQTVRSVARVNRVCQNTQAENY